MGSALMVAPVLIKGQESRNVTFPAKTAWYRADTGELAAPASDKIVKQDLPVTLDSVPAFFRGGSIIATRQRGRRSTAAAALVTTTPTCPPALLSVKQKQEGNYQYVLKQVKELVTCSLLMER